MAELNISAFVYLYGAGQPEVVTAMLTIMVSKENGAPSTGLAKKQFDVQVLSVSRDILDVTIGNLIWVELAKALPGNPPGVYQMNVSRSDGSAFDADLAWTFVIHVKDSGFLYTNEGWTITGVDYRQKAAM